MLDLPTSTFDIAVDGWQRATSAISRLPTLFASALVLIVAGEYLFLPDRMFTQKAPPDAVESVLASCSEVVTTLILASVLIAVHRFVILEERADRPSWMLPKGYFRFATCLVLIDCWSVPATLVRLLTGDRFKLVLAILSVPYLIAVIVASLRVILIFPALALSLPSARWRSSWRDMRGHVWKLIGVSALISLPMVIVALLGGVLCAAVVTFTVRNGVAVPLWVSRIAFSGYTAALTLMFSSVGAVTVSRLFQLYGHALLEPARPPAS